MALYHAMIEQVGELKLAKWFQVIMTKTLIKYIWLYRAII